VRPGVKLSVGVLGGGVMARTHVQSLLSIPEAGLRGLTAPAVDPTVAALCEGAGIAIGHDVESLLRRSDLQAVVIATPTDTHAELIKQAAAAGLHVFCEKPLARTAREARSVANVCADADIKLSVGHVVRYFPAYAEIRDAVQAGQIGRPGMAKCRRVSGPPSAAREWYGDPARSGGLITDMGVHDFDWLRWCLGPVERVSALDRGSVAMVTLAHESGAISGVELSWMDPEGFATAVEVSGPEGLLRYDSREAGNFALNLWPRPAGQGPVVQVPAGRPGHDPYRHELSDAIAWFCGGPEPRSNAMDAVAAVGLAEAARLSAERREPIAMADFDLEAGK
jgi:UDP-N-acetylglucosamine 3-dehydrogenase